jgi:hypothetical protein
VIVSSLRFHLGQRDESVTPAAVAEVPRAVHDA